LIYQKLEIIYVNIAFLPQICQSKNINYIVLLNYRNLIKEIIFLMKHQNLKRKGIAMKGIKDIILEKDTKVLNFFNVKFRSDFLDLLEPLFAYIGSITITISTCFMLMGIGNNTVKKMGFEALYALVVICIIVQFLKNTVGKKIFRKISKSSDFNIVENNLKLFPSNHTAAIFSISTTISLYYPQLTIMLFPIAALSALFRIYSGAHYPSSIIFSTFMAIGCSLSIHFLGFI
jgi:undecaprenyl-diphosphatase